jgi:hypothetical protein
VVTAISKEERKRAKRFEEIELPYLDYVSSNLSNPSYRFSDTLLVFDRGDGLSYDHDRSAHHLYLLSSEN